jgi:xylitol oxidase
VTTTVSGVLAANWAGNVVYGASAVHSPSSLDELCALVAGSPRIRAAGTGHSFSRVADTDGALVRLDSLPAEVTVEPGSSTAVVGAGMRYAAVNAALHAAGWALANLASLPHISVAGCCATGTHGSGDGRRCLAAAVTGLERVGPDGTVSWISRGEAGFDGSVVALGALGVVTRLRLEIEPAFEARQLVRLDVPLDEVAESFDEVFGAAYSVSVFTDWRSATTSVWLKQRVDRPAGAWRGGRAAVEQMHPVPGTPAGFSTLQLGVPGPWHERLPHFRPEFVPGAGEELQSEYYLPRAAAPAAIAAIRELGESVASVSHISEIRTVRGDELWLSPAYRRDCVTLHFTWIHDEAAVRPVIEAVERRLRPLGARPHWGKLTALSPAELAGCHERIGDFARLVAERDPEGKFGNAFLDAMLAGPRLRR